MIKKIIGAILMMPLFIWAQEEGEFKQKITGFEAAVDTGFVKKELNLPDRNLGVINEQDFSWTTS